MAARLDKGRSATSLSLASQPNLSIAAIHAAAKALGAGSDVVNRLGVDPAAPEHVPGERRLSSWRRLVLDARVPALMSGRQT